MFRPVLPYIASIEIIGPFARRTIPMLRQPHSGLLVLACLALCGVHANAGDKPKTAPLLSKNDELTAKDEKDTHPFLKRSARKVYTIKLAEGKVYRIDLKSKDFDAVLRLEDSAGKEVAFNDDAPGQKTLDARVFFKATASAEYKIIATCLNAKTGKFSLSVAEATDLKIASIFKSNAIELKWKNGKAHFAGELIEQDGLVFDHYYKVFTLYLEAGKTYRIDHQSGEFDARLILEDSHGNVVAENAGDSKRNARIVHMASKTGVYRVIATSVTARGTGKFVLDVAPENAR